MVKSYLRYEPALSFGVITSNESNVVHDSSGKFLITSALEKILTWDLKKGICSKTLALNSSKVNAVTCLDLNGLVLASGCSDGSVRIWDLEKGICEATLNGHKSGVSALKFERSGSVLASGSKDCDIIIWDVVAQTGLFRLKGHKDQVTDLAFIDSGKKLISCSKDKYLRVWDLEMQHCMQIVSGHQSEIWSLDTDHDERFLVTGSSDRELRFYHIKHSNNETDSSSKWDVLKHFGDISRQSDDRVSNVRFNNSGNLLACQVAGKTVEFYQVLNDTEAKRKAKRRVNRKKEKGKENGTVLDTTVDIIASDVFKLLHVLRASKKITSISFSPTTVTKGSHLATLTLSLNNNMLETYLVEGSKSSKMQTIELQGHRSDVRSLALSSDDTLLLSTSHNAVKIWNLTSGTCIRTIDSSYGLCSSFVPGDKYALVGTKEGTLEIIDVGSGSRIEIIQAHEKDKSILSIIPLPDEDGYSISKGFVTGSKDSDIKFWEYQIKQVPDSNTKQLSVVNVKTLKMSDDVLAISISPDAKYIAVSLIEYSVGVKVFFLDSLKYYLSLYGHKMPVLCMDISSDGDLIVTGSADKNIKIWGLDFGDCHKSLFAHADSVMDVKFVRNTHYVFSVGKDRLVKYWDADKFQLLLTLDGHHAEVWCLAISNRGEFIVTGSHDRSIRRWDRTEEPFFVEEEEEKRTEEMFESMVDDSNENKYMPKDDGINEEGSVALPGKKTQETLTAADMIIDALDLAEDEHKRLNHHKEDVKNGKGGVYQPNMILRGRSPSEHVLHVISNVQTNDLEQTLLSLPFSDVLKIISYLKDWSCNPAKIELVCRIATVILQSHYSQLTATAAARPMLTCLKDFLHGKVKEYKDTVGFNLAAMNHLKEMMSMKSDAPFRDAKAKLMEIRKQQSKRLDKQEVKDNRRNKKRKAPGTA